MVRVMGDADRQGRRIRIHQAVRYRALHSQRRCYSVHRLRQLPFVLGSKLTARSEPRHVLRRLPQSHRHRHFRGGYSSMSRTRSRISTNQVYLDSPVVPVDQVMDCFQMTFPPASFDSVIDKSTLDTFFCSETLLEQIPQYLDGVTKVLKHGGTFLVISFNEPEVVFLIRNDDP